MSLVRWGLLGTARINRRLIPAMRASARSTVVAVASRDPERAAAHAREWDIPAAVDGYEALLGREEVSALATAPGGLIAGIAHTAAARVDDAALPAPTDPRGGAAVIVRAHP